MKKVILGKLNNNNVINYWNIDYKKIGEYYDDNLLSKYAIVENINDYDLVKIVGTAYIDVGYEKYIMGHTINKSVVRIIDMGDDDD